jgi:hypothetical protein
MPMRSCTKRRTVTTPHAAASAAPCVRVGFQKSAWACDLQGSAARHDRGHGSTPALPDPRPGSPPADAARPRIVGQGRRAPRPAPRSRRPAQNQPQAPPGLGRPRTIRRPRPAPADAAARPSPGHPGHGVALAPRPGDQEVDLPEPLRSPTCRPATLWGARSRAWVADQR